MPKDPAPFPGISGGSSSGDSVELSVGRGADSSWVSGQVRAMVTAWAVGEPVTAAEILARRPGLGDEAAIRLIYEEICLRRDSGQDVGTTEVISRFPRWKDELEVLLGCDRMLRPLFRTAVLPEVGEDLGQFRLRFELGRGASGKTFLAAEPALADRLVVLKVIADDQEEHLSLARLQHPHIIPLFSEHTFAERGMRALCMPYLGGTSLARVLEAVAAIPLARRRGRELLEALDQIQAAYPAPAVLDGPCRRYLEKSSYDQAICWIAACLADALNEAHGQGLIHMDVKPSNVLIAGDGTPMLLDFHLARRPIRAGEPVVDRLGGTRGWMAPEHRAAVEAVGLGQTINTAVDHRADIYALGLLLRETLGGAGAAADASAERPWRLRNRSISIGLSDIVDKCLAPMPADRYHSAAALADDLRRHLNSRPLRGVPNRSLPERWNKWRRRRRTSLAHGALWLVTAATIVLVVILGQAYYRQRLDEIQQIETALASGKKQCIDGQFGEGIQTFGHALDRAGAIPAIDSLRISVRNQLRVARLGEKRAALHELAELIRFRFGIDLPNDSEAHTLARHIRALWDERDALLSSQTSATDPGSEPWIRADLIDLAITLAELRLARADAAGDARRDALLVLDQAARSLGPTPRLTRLRRSLGAKTELADGRPPNASPSAAEPALEHYDLGRFHLRAERFQEAAAEFQHVLDVRPQDFWPNFYQGLCAYRLGRAEESLAAFRVCVALAPRSAECYYNRALAAEALGKTDQSYRDYNRALELDPGLTSASLNRGILAYKKVRNEAAIADFRQALRTATDPPTLARIHYALALAHRASGDRDAALAAADDALTRGHPDARTLRDRLLSER